MALDVRRPKSYRRAWNGEAAADHLRLDWTITVCSACSCAVCWQGEFYCQQSKTAGTKQITIAEARRLNQENPTYWLRDEGIKQRLTRLVEYCRCSFTDPEGTVVPGEPCPLHPVQ